jgi:benzylsuccinate CoA-transferase BbsF subunit
VEIARRLVAACDVVIENYSAGVMEKLGLGYPELRRVKPDLVMLSTSGYGDRGPHHRYVSWGPNLEALSGLSRLSGFPGRECTMTQYAYPDTLSALHGLFAVMCALDHRSRTGEGQHVSLSQTEATIAVIGDVMMEYLADGREPQSLGNGSLHAAPHGCYRCRGEDRWCAVAVFDQAEWESFCAVLGHPEWRPIPFSTLSCGWKSGASRPADRGVTSSRGDYEVMLALQEAVAAGVVQNAEISCTAIASWPSDGSSRRCPTRRRGPSSLPAFPWA